MGRNETPEGKSVRLLRLGPQVRHALSDILMRGDVHDETLVSHSCRSCGEPVFASSACEGYWNFVDRRYRSSWIGI